MFNDSLFHVRERSVTVSRRNTRPRTINKIAFVSKSLEYMLVVKELTRASLKLEYVSCF